MTDHLSIGEVLSLLQDEFPDVTISKIRFLESQGLIDPERTPSGYRKFYEADIDRLRWILVQQREHFLPLKVIKDRLTDPEAGKGELLLAGGSPPPPTKEQNGAPPGDFTDSLVAVAAEALAEDVAPAGSTGLGGDDRRDGSALRAAEVGADLAGAKVADDEAADDDVAEEAAAPAGADADAGVDGQATQPIWMADLAKASAVQKADEAAEQARRPLHVDSGPTEVSLTVGELALASGLSEDQLRSLEQFGLLRGKPLGDDVFYDGDALMIATKAAGFLAHGVEARHLRMFKVAAEREAGFLEQLAMPLLKQRNPQARRDAVDLVEDLSALGHDLRAAMLRSYLRHHLDQA